MLRLPVALLLVVVSLGAAPAHAARVEIILDVSGSMRAAMGGETRMEAARKAIRATLAGVQPDSVVALRLYGHRVSQDNKAESCKDTELVVPFQPVDKAAFQAIVDRAQPRGQTPLTHSLEQAARDFGAEESDEERIIILVSDGEESCGGDPAAAARRLRAEGFNVRVHTIGIDVDAAARAQLEAISTATGGEYHDARNADALAQSLTRLAQKSLLVAKVDEGLGQPMRGGNGYESAVEIKPGQLYRLDHHQRKGEYDYFYVDVKGRHKVEASIETTQKTVSIEGDSFREGGYTGPFAGLTLQDGSRNKLGDIDVISRGERKWLQGTVGGEGGRLYVLIGTSYGDQHKDSRFSVKLTPVAGDAGSSGDAGGTEREAMAIRPGSYQASLEPNSDPVDFFKFTADPKATYIVRARPSSARIYLEISVADANGQVSKNARSDEEGSQAAMDGLRFPKGGPVFLRVGYWPYGPKADTDYSLDVRQEGGGGGESAADGVPGERPASMMDRVRSLFRRLVSVLLWTGIVAGVLFVGGVGGYIIGRRRR